MERRRRHNHQFLLGHTDIRQIKLHRIRKRCRLHGADNRPDETAGEFHAASKSYDGLAYTGGNGVLYSIASPTLSGTLTYSGTSQGATNAGSYVITPGGYYSTQQGYDISYVDGILTINPASLNLLGITANDTSKTYGYTLTFNGTEFTPVGLLGGDTISGVTLTSAGAVNTANVGTYAITPSAAVFSVGSAGNYTITYNNGALTVTPAALTITADNQTKVYGDANPALTATYSGLKGTDTSAVVSGLNISTTATTGSNVGSYTITAANGTATNYIISYINGILLVTAAPVTITPAPVTITAAPVVATTTASYTNVIQEGLGNFGGNELNEPAASPAKFEGVYASADSSLFLQGCLDHNQKGRSEISRHPACHRRGDPPGRPCG
ncbi:MAG: MBG-2 domain-containing protein [Deltaproteobacteria bacterium]|nr:MBG-2 domain-containing protein [Deltaproteobacteria bacterium]